MASVIFFYVSCFSGGCFAFSLSVWFIWICNCVSYSARVRPANEARARAEHDFYRERTAGDFPVRVLRSQPLGHPQKKKKTFVFPPRWTVNDTIPFPLAELALTMFQLMSLLLVNANWRFRFDIAYTMKYLSLCFIAVLTIIYTNIMRSLHSGPSYSTRAEASDPSSSYHLIGV